MGTRLSKLIIYITLVFAFIGCQKDNVNKEHSPVQFYPDPNLKLTIKNGLGYAMLGDKLIFPLFSFDSNRIWKVISYNFNTKALNHNYDFIISDTSKIYNFVQADQNTFIGGASDYSKQFIYKGISISPDKLVVLDRNLKTIKQKFLPDTLGSCYFLKALPNKTFIVVYYSFAPVSGVIMYCFDQNLDIKWKTKLINTNPSEISIGNNYIYLLDISYGISSNYFIRQYDFNGKFIKTKASDLGHSDVKVIKTNTEGALILSQYVANNKRNVLAINIYDQNLTVITSKLLNTQLFSYTDAFQFRLASDIIKTDNDYYFTVNVDNYNTQNLKTTETKLVKLNRDLEIEWVKSLDKRRLLDDYGFLLYNNSHFLNMGKSIWNGIEGISFIQTDIDGNIVK